MGYEVGDPVWTEDSDRWFYDAAAAERACDFFPLFITHQKGALKDRPFELEEWQKRDIIRPTFGMKTRCSTSCKGVDCELEYLADGHLAHPRRYKYVYVEIPRKNGKTSLTAGLADLLLVLDNEPGGEIYVAAGERDQAAICFRMAKDMLEASADLLALVEVRARMLTAKESRTTFQAVSSEAFSKMGYNPSAVIFDEFHVQPNDELYEALHTGVAARDQPIEFFLTTAGFDRSTICWKFHQRAINVLEDPSFNERFLPVIYAAPQDAELDDPEVQKAANPNLGVSVREEYLREEVAEALKDPSKENATRRLHFNIWTEQENRYLAMNQWAACGADPIASGPCFIGGDLAATEDITSLAAFWPQTNSLMAWYWCPEDRIVLRSRRDGVPYDGWARNGMMFATPGNVTDYSRVRQFLVDELRNRYLIQEIMLDRWNASHLSNELQDDGFQVAITPMTAAHLSAPMKEFKRLVTSGKLRHGNDPVLTWMAGNLAVREDSEGNVRPDKGKSGEKIDGIVAAILALMRVKEFSAAPVPNISWGA